MSLASLLLRRRAFVTLLEWRLYMSGYRMTIDASGLVDALAIDLMSGVGGWPS